MIGLVLVTHGKLAEEFRHAVEHVAYPVVEAHCFSVFGGEGVEDDTGAPAVVTAIRPTEGRGVANFAP